MTSPDNAMPILVAIDGSESALRAAHWAAAAVAEAAPELPVTVEVVRGPVVTTVLGLTRRTELLVLGSRGLGGFIGLTLGSVSQALIHHSPCPVMIARPHGSE
jgi:nucleotide-binding universal stress UspA family protein